MKERVLVTGAGGFIGHHLVNFLKKEYFWVRGVDIKNPEYEETKADEFFLSDLREKENCLSATKDIDIVFNLAADMGGIGFIEANKADIMYDNTLINTHMIESARVNKIKKYLYSSSACVYPMYLQDKDYIEPLKEDDAYPADPEDGYGWEKLFAERMCRHYMEDYNLNVFIVRFHNVYGPLGTYEGGREKSPAAICRKIALTENGEIEVWGDGGQNRSYCYIDDCIEGLFKLINSDFHDPINLGSDKMVTINELVNTTAKIAGKKIVKNYDLTKPVGVRSRNSDNSKLKEVLGWEPRISLEEGLKKTYGWIKKQYVN